MVAIFLAFCLSNAHSSPVIKHGKSEQQTKENKTKVLQWKVFTVSRPGLTRDPNMPDVNDSLKWVANTSTLIYGEKDAVLVDCFLTIDQANALADSIAATGKNLKYIYITHPHGDHFFGLRILLDRFPGAKAISTRECAADCVERIQPEVISTFWAPRFPGQMPSKFTAPQAMQGNEIDLEGKKLVVIEAGFCDTHHSTSLYVPSIGLLVAGDVVYNGIHLYMVETTPETRKQWIDALDKLMALHPKTVIAGHKKPANADSPDNIASSKKYIEDFNRFNSETSTSGELFDKMIAVYPDRANPSALWGSALAAKKATN